MEANFPKVYAKCCGPLTRKFYRRLSLIQPPLVCQCTLGQAADLCIESQKRSIRT